MILIRDRLTKRIIYAFDGTDPVRMDDKALYTPVINFGVNTITHQQIEADIPEDFIACVSTFDDQYWGYHLESYKGYAEPFAKEFFGLDNEEKKTLALAMIRGAATKEEVDSIDFDELPELPAMVNSWRSHWRKTTSASWNGTSWDITVEEEELPNSVQAERSVAKIDKRQLYKQMQVEGKWGQLKAALASDQDLSDYYDSAFYFNINEPEVQNMATALGLDAQDFFNAAGEL